MAKKKTDRTINTPDILRAVTAKPKRKRKPKNVSNALGAEPTPVHFKLAELRVEIRTALDTLGVPKIPKGAVAGSIDYENAVINICTKINALIAKHMDYTFDQNLKPDSMINLR
jgi:hypothetical protein